MSKTTNPEVPLEGGTAEQRLARLLEAPFLARVVPHLPPETLHRLVLSRGLDACSELVTLATPAQLTALLDLDLWRPARPGRDERLDVDRFGEWLEVLVDAGSEAAARTIAALDPDLVVVGLSRHVRVLDPGIFEPTAPSDDEPIDRDEAMREGDSIEVDEAEEYDRPVPDSPAAGLECEVAGYVVRARRSDAWDAILTLLVALDAEHGDFFHAVMKGCRRLSNSRPEVDGLDDLLQAPEQHLHQVAIEREHRRSQQGYATPADARAFLEMARRPGRGGTTAVNPIVAAYFRAAEARDASEGSARLRDSATDVPESLEAVLELLAEAGVVPERPRALLVAADADPQDPRLAHLRRLMAFARDTDEAAFLARSRELAFLANALLAGCSVQGRPFTPQEASDAAAATCNLGLAATTSDSWLADHDLVTAFEAGWSVLHQGVSLFVAERLIATLAALHLSDRDLRRGLVALQRALAAERDAGTPWHARDTADVLERLDPIAGIAVLGLLSECPVVPEALGAVLEGRTGSISPTAFEFISTAAQVEAVRALMRKLPDLLAR